MAVSGGKTREQGTVPVHAVACVAPKNLLVRVILSCTFAKEPVRDENAWRRMALMVAGSRFFGAGRRYTVGDPVGAFEMGALVGFWVGISPLRSTDIFHMSSHC